MAKVSKEAAPTAADEPSDSVPADAPQPGQSGASSSASRPLSWYFTGWRLYAAVLVLLVLFPQFIGNNGNFVDLIFGANEGLLQVGISIGIYVILALGLNIVVGYAGLLDLGYVAFYALGAYFVATFTQGFIVGSDGQTPINLPIFSWWLLFPLAAVVASFFGVLLGAPTLRLRGDYLAIVTLGFGAIVPFFFNNSPYFGKANGMSANGPSDILGISFTSPIDHIWFYYLTLATVVLVIFAVKALRDSSLGRAWVAIREDETAAAASGVNLVRTKLLAFALGALFGGVGGALFAGFTQNVDTSSLNFNLSIFVLVSVVLGGIGSIPGVIIGAALLRFLDAYGLGQLDQLIHTSALVAPSGAPLHFLFDFELSTIKYLIYGLIMIIMIRFRPQGLIPDVRRKRELAGTGGAAESESAVGLLAAERADEAMNMAEAAGDSTVYTGPGSDAAGREG